MKTHSTHTRLARSLTAVLFVFTLLFAQPVFAQDGQPPVPTDQPVDRPPDPGFLLDGEAFQETPQENMINNPGPDMRLEWGSANGTAQESQQAAPSVPDYYGYTYDNATYSWIDVAGSGTQAPLTTDGAEVTSAIQIPFSFPFYENSYSRLYIAKYGYLTFSDSGYARSQSSLPNQYYPNNVIAPYWTPMGINRSGAAGHVYYKSYGTTPGQRYFAIQWYQMKGTYWENDDIGGDDLYDFEVILHENGDIVFQYRQMAYNGGDYDYWCGYAGIEDMRGNDGLSSEECGKITSKSAVRYTRPTERARVLLYPNRFGAFGVPGGQADIPIPLKNIGTLGVDTFDLQVSCPVDYAVEFLDGATLVPLEDTNSSGYPDTGPVAQGASKTVLARFTMPSVGNLGDSARCNFWAIPGLEFDQWRYAELAVAYPAPFTQVYRDDTNSTMRLTTVKPDSQPEYTASSTNVGGSNTAVAEAPNGNIVYAWTQSRCAGTNCSQSFTEIYYTIRKKTGEAVKAPTLLQNLSSLAYWGLDRTPAIAVAPDGTIGITFVRYLTRSDYKRIMNVMLARINASGTLLGTISVTNNTTYSTNHPWLYEPSIATTGDNRFAMAWEHYSYSSSSSTDDIYSAFYNSSGSVARAPAKRTSDTTSSSDGYADTTLTAIGNNQVVLGFRSFGDDDIMYQVLNSGGSLIKATTNLTNDGTSYYEYQPDVARFSNGNLLFSFIRNGQVCFIILDSGYVQQGAISRLNYIGIYPAGVSATTDNAGHGIITWIDDDVMNNTAIYYAAVNSDGEILTNSMVMKRTTGSYVTGWMGNNNTSFTIAPTSANTDLFINGLAQVVTAPGRSTTLKLPFGNLGLAPASTITITADKSDELLFGSIPDASCSGNNCTWTLTDANVGYLGSGVVNLPITMPSVAVGTTYQVTVHISSPETDDIATNNDLVIEFIAGLPTYVPFAARK